MKILVTGVTGFIGSKLVTHLNLQGHLVYEISSNKSKNKKIVHIPLSNLSKLNHFFKKNKFDAVIHLAARIGETKPLEMFKANCENTINLLECCKSNNVKKFVFTSSHAVYGNSKHLPIEENTALHPITNYAISKLISENICKMYHYSYGLEVVILRISSVYGMDQSYERLIPTLINNVFDEQRITLHKYDNGFQIMDLIHVDDVCRAISLAANSKIKFGIFNIATGKSITVKQISNMLSKIIMIKSIHVKKIAKNTNHFLYDISLASRYLKFRPQICLDEYMLNKLVTNIKQKKNSTSAK